MSTIAFDNAQPSAGGTAYAIAKGVLKATLAYNQATPVIDADENISSVTDDAVGRFTPNFTNVFSDALGGFSGYCVSSNPDFRAATPGLDNGTNTSGLSTSDCGMQTGMGSNTAGTDVVSRTGWWGDLA